MVVHDIVNVSYSKEILQTVYKKDSLSDKQQLFESPQNLFPFESVFRKIPINQTTLDLEMSWLQTWLINFAVLNSADGLTLRSSLKVTRMLGTK